MKWIPFFSVLFFISCSTTKNIDELTDQDIVIKMEKEGCFGKCPVYTLSIYKGGYTLFAGVENTYKLGTHSMLLSKDKYKELISEFKQADLFQFEDYYETKIPDLPTVKIFYREKDKEKTIVGKRERPSEVHKLQFLLEQIAESRDAWKVIDGTVEDKKEKIDHSKIVIQLKDGAQLSRWFNNVRENYGIRILKKLDNSYDKWIVSYNMQDYRPDEILEILKNDPNVSSAEFPNQEP